jgi:hypothetical protein
VPAALFNSAKLIERQVAEHVVNGRHHRGWLDMHEAIDSLGAET